MKLAQGDTGHVNYQDLETQIKTLTMEAGIVANLASSFSNILPALKDTLSNAVASLVDGNDEVSKLVKEIDDDMTVIHEKQSQIRFVDYSDTLVDVPEGFVGSLSLYTKTLSDMSQRIIANGLVEIKAFNAVLAQYVGSRDGKISIRDHTNIAKRLDKIRRDSTEILSEFHSPKSDHGKRRLSDVVYNFDDMDLLAKRIRLLASDYKGFDIKEFSTVVAKTDDYLKLAYLESEDGDLPMVSGPQAVNISECVRSVAEFVTFIATFRYHMQTAITTSGRVANIFRKK